MDHLLRKARLGLLEPQSPPFLSTWQFTFYTEWSLAAPTAPVKSPYLEIETGTATSV